jgi:outer membrane lipoprotein-sorting protein
MGYSMTQVFDGQKAMMTNPQTGEVIELPPEQAKSMMKQALGNDSILNPEKYGISYSYKGEETVDGKKCLTLEQKYQDGEISTMYLDSATYLPYKTKSKSLSQTGTEVEIEAFLSDYKKVGNIWAAHSITIFQAGAEYIRMTFSEITYNNGLEDSLFVLK